MEVALPAVALAIVVALVVLWPLGRGHAAASERADRRADLEAAKEAKYREIKDAELDFRMGKLSEADWKGLDAELRAQAIAILRDLDRVDGR